MQQAHIHSHRDGRGPRIIFVNGNKIDRVFYADTEKGVVKFYPQPTRVHSNGVEAYSRELRGKVTVEFTNG